MPTIYLKSGGQCECDGYTIKDNCVKAVGVKFIDTKTPEKKDQPEAVIPLCNILYITK